MGSGAAHVPPPGQSPAASQYYPDGRGKFNDFRPPSPVQSTWPSSLTSGVGLLSVDPAALRQVAGAMWQDIADIQAVLADLQANGLVTESDLGTWDAPSGLATATINAFAGLTSFIADLISAHDAVTGRIAKSAQLYAETEAANKSLSSRTSG